MTGGAGVAVVAAVAGWLLTYLVHSTLLLAAAALLGRFVLRREALKETVWKAAMVGAVVTATAASALPRTGGVRVAVPGLEALGAPSGIAAGEAAGSVVRGEAVAEAEAEAAALGGAESEVGADIGADIGAEAGRGSADVPVGPTSRDEATPVPTVEEAAGSVSGAAPAEPAAGPGGASLFLAAGLGIWAAVSALLLARLAYRHARLRWLLRGRAEVVDGRGDSGPGAVSALAELRRSVGYWKPVRLTTTPHVATPLALGAWEICVPDRFLTDLASGEQRAALAHELAHLRRRDPLWNAVGGVVGAVFFFQPLNGMARRRIREAAEYLADGWAVRHTGEGVELARCLAAVAGWAAPAREPVLTGTLAMAEGGSPLLVRVDRLLRREPEPHTRPVVRATLAAALVVAVAGFAPVVGPGGMAPADGAALADAAAPADRAGAEAEADAGRDPGADVADDASQDDLEVRRFDGPATEGDGFVARLNEAGRDARQDPYWVAYSLTTVEPWRGRIMDTDGWRTSELGGPPLAERLGVEDVFSGAEDEALVLVRIIPTGAAARVERLTVRSPDVGMRDLAGTLYWLGEAEPAASYGWLRDIYTASRDPDLRELTVEAIGLHPVPDAVSFLRRVFGADESGPVREEALGGLGRQEPDTALARILLDAALRDPDADVRQEAVELMERLPVSLSVPLLERVLAESTDPDVVREAVEVVGGIDTAEARAILRAVAEGHPVSDARDEALEQLVEDDIAADGSLLLSLAFTADDPDVRREAVEYMADLPSDEAVALLRRVVFESGDGTSERQAAETLGDIGTRAAFDVLVEILARNPSEDAAFQAVEAIAEGFPRDMALPALGEAARTHPSSRVRREALDRLADMGG